jgi:hypothetical protein
MPEATWGIRILLVWIKAAREQLITNNPSWIETIKQDISPAAIWNFRNAGTYLFLNHQLKGYCQEWHKYVGSPKTQETQLSMQILAKKAIHYTARSLPSYATKALARTQGP